MNKKLQTDSLQKEIVEKPWEPTEAAKRYGKESGKIRKIQDGDRQEAEYNFSPAGHCEDPEAASKGKPDGRSGLPSQDNPGSQEHQLQ